jgi:hypothetical protein
MPREKPRILNAPRRVEMLMNGTISEIDRVLLIL